MSVPLARLPHAYPFRFADSVVRKTGEAEGTVRASFSAASWGGRGGPPLLYGELIAQSALLLEGGDADLGRSGFLAGLSGLEVHRAPEAGDVLDVDVKVVARFGAVTRFGAELRDAAGALVARGEVTVRKG